MSRSPLVLPDPYLCASDEELAIDGVADLLLQRPDVLPAWFCPRPPSARSRPGPRSPPSGGSGQMATMWMAWLSWRLPRRRRRWTTLPPRSVRWGLHPHRKRTGPGRRTSGRHRCNRSERRPGSDRRHRDRSGLFPRHWTAVLDPPVGGLQLHVESLHSPQQLRANS